MEQGFIFDQQLCVNCKACAAACSLENKFPVKARSIYTYNEKLSASVALSNLSVACNHCEVPVCLNGCPSSAYSRDQLTGAVVIDDTKCIGCKYCIWNCPFDAPVYDNENRVIGKCHLCYSSLSLKMEPACTSACPTGALSFGDLNIFDQANAPEWFPGADINPAMRFCRYSEKLPLRIIPGSLFTTNMKDEGKEKKKLKSEWSLILFSFLSVISVSMVTLSLITGKLPDKTIFFSLTLLPGLVSLFHLGKWTRAWRAILNVKKSPISREIILYILYAVISIPAVVYGIPVLIMSASVTGLFLLLLIDAVYIYTSRSLKGGFHSGQTFISALLTISFLSGFLVPFLFIASLKIILMILKYDYDPSSIAVLRFFRLALLFVAGASIVSGISYGDPSIIFIFLAGELTDRIIFYYDFNPEGITDRINKHITRLSYEKKRD